MRAGIRVQRWRGERAPHNHRVGPSLRSGIGALRTRRFPDWGRLEARCYSLPPMSGANFALHAFGADIHPGAALVPRAGLAFNAGNS
jgi:hypothetical protein